CMLAGLLPLAACYQPQTLDARSVLNDVEQEQRAQRAARSTAAAALPPEAQQGISEDEAVALALKLNPDLRAARKQIGVAEAEVIAAGALKNPTVDMDVLHLEELSKRKAWAVTLGWEPPQPEVRSARRAAANAAV